MKHHVILLFVMVCSGACFAQKVDTVAMKKAKPLIEQKKYDDAKQIFNKLIATDSNNAVYYDARGFVWMLQNKYPEAMSDFSRALALEPNNPEYYYHRSQALYHSENPNEAISDCNDALKHMHADDSLKWQVIMNRGSSEEMKRDFPSAYADFKLLLEHDSTDYGALSNMGIVLAEMGRDNEALVYLEKVVHFYPKFSIGYSNLAFWHQLHGNFEKSIEIINEGMTHLDPEDFGGRAVMYNNRSYDKLKLKKLPEAMEDVNKSLKLYPQNSYALRNRALVYIAMMEKDKACEDLRESLRQGFTLMYGNEVRELMKANCPAASIPDPDDETTR